MVLPWKYSLQIENQDVSSTRGKWYPTKLIKWATVQEHKTKITFMGYSNIDTVVSKLEGLAALL